MANLGKPFPLKFYLVLLHFFQLNSNSPVTDNTTHTCLLFKTFEKRENWPKEYRGICTDYLKYALSISLKQ